MGQTKVRTPAVSPNDETFRGSAIDPLIEAVVGDFRVEAVLGRGAAGIVYEAVELLTGRKVAFKVLKPEFAHEPEYIRRLIEEAKALSALRHPGIIDIIDFGALKNGQPYLVMELCDGLSLEDQLKLGGKPTLRETLGLLDELLGALEAAHDHGIIHRDVKPSNLFLATDANGKRSIKVLDFGLARLGDNSRAHPTAPGTMLGTPDYMAPEQVTGKEIGTWTDVYATGGIAFRLLTDRLPFIAKTAMAVIAKKLEAPPPHARDIDPKIAPELDALVDQMLSKDLAKRPSLREARARFAAYLKGLNRGPTPSMPDDAESLRPTTFHQFDDQAAARRPGKKTQPHPALSPPSRGTDLEPRFSAQSPSTELEPAFVPGNKSGPGWKRRALLLVVVSGAGGAVAWWLTHR